jgi:hypothetical protein
VSIHKWPFFRWVPPWRHYPQVSGCGVRKVRRTANPAAAGCGPRYKTAGFRAHLKALMNSTCPAKKILIYEMDTLY